jgi:hypothetical protein
MAYRARIGRRFVPTSTIRRRLDAQDARYARPTAARQLGLASESWPYASVEIVRVASPDADELDAWDAFRATQLEPVDEPDVLVSELEGTRCTMASCGGCGRCG